MKYSPHNQLFALCALSAVQIGVASKSKYLKKIDFFNVKEKTQNIEHRNMVKIHSGRATVSSLKLVKATEFFWEGFDTMRL